MRNAVPDWGKDEGVMRIRGTGRLGALIMVISGVGLLVLIYGTSDNESAS